MRMSWLLAVALGAGCAQGEGTQDTALQAQVDALSAALQQAQDAQSSQDDALSALADQVDALAADVANIDSGVDVQALDERVTALEAAVTAAQAKADGNTIGIATNQSAIATNQGAIASNSSDIATNAAAIGANTSAIGTSQSAISDNADAIGVNAGHIASNTSAISANQQGVATSKADIASNATAIATNKDDIALNTTATATNADGIDVNAAEITTNAKGVSGNASQIASNAQAIAKNADDLSALTTQVGGLAVPPRSCLEIHQADTTAPSGWYDIAPTSGNTAAARYRVWCDMNTSDGTSAGGWTVIALQTFDDGFADGWSDRRVDVSNCGAYFTPILGGFGNFGVGAATQRTFDLLHVPHTQAYVSLDYIGIDTWDGEPRYEEIDGAEQLGTTAPRFGGNECGISAEDPGLDHVVRMVGHVDDALTLRVSSGLDQSSTDESWGIDNVLVMVR